MAKPYIDKIVNNEIELVFFGLAHDKIVGGVKVTYKLPK